MASKTSLSESAEVKEAATSTASTVADTTSTKKYNVVRYCQIRELSSGFTRIMKTRYPMEAHTLAEWDSLYEYVRTRKVG